MKYKKIQHSLQDKSILRHDTNIWQYKDFSIMQGGQKNAGRFKSPEEHEGSEE